jgi:hypothetical protein
MKHFLLLSNFLAWSQLWEGREHIFENISPADYVRSRILFIAILIGSLDHVLLIAAQNKIKRTKYRLPLFFRIAYSIIMFYD